MARPGGREDDEEMGSISPHTEAEICETLLFCVHLWEL